jgi:hypothetical protein
VKLAVLEALAALVYLEYLEKKEFAYEEASMVDNGLVVCLADTCADAD